jgi:sulfur carrier protein
MATVAFVVIHYFSLTILVKIQLIQITINGKAREFEATISTLADLVEKLGLTGKRLAIERNGEIVPKSTFAEVSLQNGDKLEIVGAVGGG